MTSTVILTPLTAGAFAPFGDSVGAPSIGERIALGPTLVAVDGATQPRLSFNHVEPCELPLRVTDMERHNHSSQCFIALNVSRWIVVVAADWKGAPDPSTLRAFVARGDQAVNYHLGTWHHPVRVLDHPGRFAVLMWTTGSKSADEEWARLPEPMVILP